MKRFLEISLGSCGEVDTKLLVSFDLGFFSDDELLPLSNEINRIRLMMVNFMRDYYEKSLRL
ncbi:four helix bundle protein [Flavobacterium sp.]|uniref:four helix bundle protein n=1 Tax=Flavobacterium sp. TaxID=239 RepID=UPI003D0CB810